MATTDEIFMEEEGYDRLTTEEVIFLEQLKEEEWEKLARFEEENEKIAREEAY